MKISIITPFYNEGSGVDLYFKGMLPILKSLETEFEIVCVDDGSIDDTKSRLLQWGTYEEGIIVISLSRNFGKEAALTAGFDYATGNTVIPVDADMQDPPSIIREMVVKWKEGYKIVNAVRRSRSDGFFKNWSSIFYHKVLNILTEGRIPANVGDFRLIDRKVLEAISSLRERTRYMKGVVSWVGFKSTSVYYDRPERAFGDSKIGFFSLLKHAYDGIFSFSTKPLKVWLYLGIAISLTSFGYACFLIAKTVIYGSDLPGYASLMVAILFMGGVQLISIGVIGQYIARIFKEVKGRPIYIVDEVYGIQDKA